MKKFSKINVHHAINEKAHSVREGYPAMPEFWASKGQWERYDAYTFLSPHNIGFRNEQVPGCKFRDRPLRNL